MSLPEPEVLASIVSRVFNIESVTWGDPQHGYIVHYRGSLRTDDPTSAYAQLNEALRPLDITPLFRVEAGRQVVVLVAGVVRPTPAKVSVNIALFILTLLSVLFAGAMYSYTGPMPESLFEQIKTYLLNIWVGWPFAVSLLAILLAHEFGHYFAGRLNRTAVTLPYFIPFPVSILGTMGAFIQLKERPRNKRVLFDIGVAGPLAGLVVAIPVLILGLLLSDLGPVTDTAYASQEIALKVCDNPVLAGGVYTCPNDDLLEGNSLLYLTLKFVAKGQWLPTPMRYDLPFPVYWARYVVTGQPIPFGGQDIFLHPVAMAGWAGILVTFLNLIPAGQLDGGHVLYALFGKRVRFVLPVIVTGVLVMGIFWTGWWLWAVLIFMFGRVHAEPLDQITTLDARRKALAGLILIVFLLVLTPVPFTVF